MNTEQKIEAIKDAIEKAKSSQSGLTASNFDVPALVSLKGRHLYNNLGALSRRVLEIGSHLGGSLTSTISNNNLISATAIDNFASDLVEERKCMPLFLENISKHLPEDTKFYFRHRDAFEVPLSEIPDGIDMYIYDGSHDMESQRKAVSHYLDKMADVFIFIVDDADWQEVKIGTELGIQEANVEVLYFKHLKSGGDHCNDTWWNGYFIYLLKKKK